MICFLNRKRPPWKQRPGLLIPLVLTSLFLTACGGPSPRIAVEPSSLDLGDRPQEPLELTYTIRNEGESSLEIEKVSTSCGCTHAAVDQVSIPAGGTTLLRVTLDPTEDNLFGNILRVIYVRSNDPDNPEVEVEFQVTIQKPEAQEG